VACSAQPVSAPTTEIAETPIEAAQPVATPTLIPQDSEYANQVMQVYEMVTFMYAKIEVINETASRLSAGDIEASQAKAILTNEAANSRDFQQPVDDYQVPTEFLIAWNQEVDAYSTNAELVDQWLAEEIGPHEVMEGLVSARSQSVAALDNMDELVVQLFGVDPTQLALHRENYRNLMYEYAFGHERTACAGADPVKDGSGKGEQIAFVSDRGGTPEIYLISDDGTDLTLVTEGGLGAFHPAWSPDGEKIAFFSYRDGNAEIYVINADGTGLTRLTNHNSDDFDPAWSPDGTQIAFHSHRYGPNPQIYVMNADGSNVVRITNPPKGGWSPVWSPDGTQIAVNSSYGPSRDIWIMNADGSELEKKTFASADDWWPDWSPDGQFIVFHSERDGNFEIYVLEIGTLAETRLTESPGQDYDPAWSSDGTRIAFSSNEGQISEICIMNADGSGIANLTDDPSTDIAAAWRP